MINRLINNSMVDTIYNCIVLFPKYDITVKYLEKELRESKSSLIARYEPGAISYGEKIRSSSQNAYDHAFYEQADEEDWIRDKLLSADRERRRAKMYINQIVSNCSEEEKKFVESFVASVNDNNVKKGKGYENSTKEMKRIIRKYCEY